MDALLELMKKYKTPHNRGSNTCKEFLQILFRDYLKDLEEAMIPENNPLYGKKMCERMKKNMADVRELCSSLLKIFELYELGQQSKAATISFSCFNKVKPFLMTSYTGVWKKEYYYRVRSYTSEHPYDLDRKELFHIPFYKREICSSERYSVPGYPCLYLATQPQLCWYECKRPKRFAISKFDVPQEEGNTMLLVDFSEKIIPLAHSFFAWRYNEKDTTEVEKIEKYLCKFLVTYPLRAACSMIASYSSGVVFKEEYIVPQLLLQWINADTDFEGVKYESVSEFGETHSYGGVNVVFVSKGFDADGYALNLRNRIKVATPKLFNIDEMASSECMSKGKSLEECATARCMEDGPEDYDFI